MRLVHLTDPHLSDLGNVSYASLRGKRWSGYLSWRKNRRKKYLPAVLEKLSVAVRAEEADQVLVTGDLVHIGLESEIRQAAQWLKQLAAPDQLMLVPGNHDVYAQGSDELVRRLWGEYLFHGCDGQDTRFPVVRQLDGLRLIGVSTACTTPLFMATGILGQTQLSSLSELLKSAASEHQPVCLLIHHPPLPGMTNWRKELSDAESLQKLLERFPPALIFHGHLHHNREQQFGNTRICCTAAASSVSDASYRVVDIEPRGDVINFRMRLKTIAMDDQDKLQFVTVDEQTWQQAG
jgi:3',5'-cyclic AMP phosphodiesterase CpdA